MRLFDSKTLKITLNDVNLDKGDYYSKTKNLESAKELMLILLNFDQISGLLILMHQQKHKYVELSELFKEIFTTIEAINTLAIEYYKNNWKRYPSRTIYYSSSDVSRLKISLGALHDEIMKKTNLQKHADNYIPEALVLIMRELRLLWAKLSYSQSHKGSDYKKANGKMKKEMNEYFTEVDWMFNPMFEFEVQGRVDKTLNLGNQFIIETDEMHERYIENLKVELKNKFIHENDLKIDLLDLDSKPTICKMDVKNAPSMIIIWFRNADQLHSDKLFEFNLSQFSDNEKCDMNVPYRLSAILSYNAHYKSFEIINRIHENWNGLANNDEV
jgi:hypothetical protein